MRLHLDTDFAGNVDDAFALAMLLGWPEVELAGVTTVGDEDGRRAGCVRRLLQISGRDDVPLARGAALSLTDGRRMGKVQDVVRYWRDDVPPVSSPPGAALDLLAENAARGATVVATGPATNLASLATTRPEALRDVPVVMMGGWSSTPPAGFPQWGAERDTNVVRDVAAMRLLLASGARLTLVPLAATVRCHLRAPDLPRLREAGRLGELLAHQAELYASDLSTAELARRWPGLPDDLVTFLHDPLTCAVAAGWAGVEVEHVRVRSHVEDDALRLERAHAAHHLRLVTDVDGETFTTTFLDAVQRAAGSSPPFSTSSEISGKVGDMSDKTSAPAVLWVTLTYRDAPAALDFLVKAFGFEERARYTGETENVIVHAELRWPGGGGVMLGSADSDSVVKMQPGTGSSYIVVDTPEEVDALFDRAVKAGATVVREPTDEDYGGRDFVVRDPEGTYWSFGTYAGEGG